MAAFHLDSWLSLDGRDLLYNLRRTVWAHESPVDPHLESVPSLRMVTTRSFPCSYSQSLGRHPNRSFHFEILFLHASDQVSTYLLQRLHIEAGEGDPTGTENWASWWLSGKESTHNAGDVSLIPGLGRSPGEGNGNPF